MTGPDLAEVAARALLREVERAFRLYKPATAVTVANNIIAEVLVTLADADTDRALAMCRKVQHDLRAIVRAKAANERARRAVVTMPGGS